MSKKNNTAKPSAALPAPDATSRAGKASAAPEQVLGAGEHAPDYARCRIAPGAKVKLKDIDPDDSQQYHAKPDVESELKAQRKRIADLQARLFAEGKQSLLIVLQALDTGGKDGTIKGVFRGVNPQGCQVWSFKAPGPEEAEHDFLWRYSAKAPPRGMITIFNRSHYEDVLVVRVKKMVDEEVWRALQDDQRVGEYAEPQQHRHHQVLPAHLEGRAEEAARIEAARAREELEVLVQRYQGARLLGRLPEGIRGRHLALLDRIRAVVCGAQQQEVVSQPGGGAHHRRHARSHEPAVPRAREGPGQSAHRLSARLEIDQVV